MDNELVDQPIDTSKKKFNWRLWIVPMIAGLGFITCFLQGIFFTQGVLIAIILTISASILNFYRPKLGALFMLIVCLAGTIELIEFFPIRYSLYLSINNSPLGFELLAGILSFVHFVLNHDEIVALFKKRD